MANSLFPGEAAASSTTAVMIALVSDTWEPCSRRRAGSCFSRLRRTSLTASCSQRPASWDELPGTSSSTGSPVRSDRQSGSSTRRASRTSGRLARTQSDAVTSSITAAGPSGVSSTIVAAVEDATKNRSQAPPRCGFSGERPWATSRRPGPVEASRQVDCSVSKPSSMVPAMEWPDRTAAPSTSPTRTAAAGDRWVTRV